jgi:hypothetical protein
MDRPVELMKSRMPLKICSFRKGWEPLRRIYEFCADFDQEDWDALCKSPMRAESVLVFPDGEEQDEEWNAARDWWYNDGFGRGYEDYESTQSQTTVNSLNRQVEPNSNAIFASQESFEEHDQLN